MNALLPLESFCSSQKGPYLLFRVKMCYSVSSNEELEHFRFRSYSEVLAVSGMVEAEYNQGWSSGDYQVG